jgi:hypothetical protein
MSSYLIDYPFAGRLFPSALAVLGRLRSFGPTVILSDGDVVFQPHLIGSAFLFAALVRESIRQLIKSFGARKKAVPT